MVFVMPKRSRLSSKSSKPRKLNHEIIKISGRSVSMDTFTKYVTHLRKARTADQIDWNEFERRRSELHNQLFKEAGFKFNPNSTLPLRLVHRNSAFNDELIVMVDELVHKEN